MLFEDGDCPNCAKRSNVATAVLGQHRRKVKPQAPQPAPVQHVYIEPSLPIDPNPPGYRWSKADGRWMPAKQLDEQDRKCAIGMVMMFVVAALLVIVAMVANAPR